ncbi:MAG: hypothetical protein JJU00_18430 [Opitutales bacterium]|nr:hypothetical protein [Opitutales bacterium]
MLYSLRSIADDFGIIVDLSDLKSLFSAAGTVRLYAKPLAENDNSKNQVYFGPDFESLNIFPNGGIEAAPGAAKSIFKAKMDFGWLTGTGAVAPAPNARLILYPQYPEVRFSGFLKGCAAAPSPLMASRLAGRVLFLGVTASRRVVGYVAAAESAVASEFRRAANLPQDGVFFRLSLPSKPDEADTRALLLGELGRIHRKGWIDSKQLGADGGIRPCRAAQCGGFTLEAELNIPKNSAAEPDFLGWEIKQHSVPRFSSLGGAITLMTPEPTGGYYREAGVDAFVRRYGYPDKKGVPDRLNFGGVHRVARRHPLTGLRMELAGYDAGRRKILDADGCVALVDANDTVAAAWDFAGLFAHWSKKHTRAAYVPSLRRTTPAWQYAYGPRVRLAERTDALRLLAALAAGAVYYDPGIKIESASTRPRVKRRSQFRIASKDIAALYDGVEAVEV